MFVTFIITIRVPFYQIMDFRDTRAYILDPCIQEFLKKKCGQILPILWQQIQEIDFVDYIPDLGHWQSPLY